MFEFDDFSRVRALVARRRRQCVCRDCACLLLPPERLRYRELAPPHLRGDAPRWGPAGADSDSSDSGAADGNAHQPDPPGGDPTRLRFRLWRGVASLRRRLFLRDLPPAPR
eukprot:6446714-Alexandrium_andersonii.AAC.1